MTSRSTPARAAGTPALRRGFREPFAAVPLRVHLLGAGGAGVSGAARILAEHGHALSAADRGESEYTAGLRELGIPLAIGAAAASLLPDEVELVVRSAAIPATDACVLAAEARGIPVIKYGDLLGRISPAGRTLAIAGTHGKTTTAWLAYHALRALAASRPGGPAPGALIGGICRTLGVNALAAESGGWFAVEACEYDRTFLQLAPRGAAILNVEADHLDYYGTLDAIEAAFARFADRVHPDGLLVVGPQVPRRVESAARCAVWRLGREIKAELTGERAGTFAFRLETPAFQVATVALAVPGEFNVDNAALALALTAALAARDEGLAPEAAARAAARGIEAFGGSRRRFEPWGECGAVRVVHDYAHHPTEVRATLEAARRVHPSLPLHVLFQPHQHSRTARFLCEFAESLRFADRVVVADVYGARAHIDGEHAAGAQELAAELARLGVDAAAGGPLESSVRSFASGLPEACAAFVLGAGDVVGVKDALFDELALRRAEARSSRR